MAHGRIETVYIHQIQSIKHAMRIVEGCLRDFMYAEQDKPLADYCLLLTYGFIEFVRREAN